LRINLKVKAFLNNYLNLNFNLMFKQFLSIGLVLMIALSISCKGPEGEVGPKGDTGATGPAGPAGPAGKDGESTGGNFGSLVVLMEENVETDADGHISFGSDTFFEGATPSQKESFEKGSFQVFLKEGGAYFPVPGPVLFSVEQDVVSYAYYYEVVENAFGVSIFRTSNTEKPVRKFEEVRLLIIPAMMEGGRSAVNWSNYDEAVKALGLTEKDVRRLK
jgi:hypothetical protein